MRLSDVSDGCQMNTLVNPGTLPVSASSPIEIVPVKDMWQT